MPLGVRGIRGAEVVDVCELTDADAGSGARVL